MAEEQGPESTRHPFLRGLSDPKGRMPCLAVDIDQQVVFPACRQCKCINEIEVLATAQHQAGVNPAYSRSLFQTLLRNPAEGLLWPCRASFSSRLDTTLTALDERLPAATADPGLQCFTDGQVALAGRHVSCPPRSFRMGLLACICARSSLQIYMDSSNAALRRTVSRRLFELTLDKSVHFCPEMTWQRPMLSCPNPHSKAA